MRRNIALDEIANSFGDCRSSLLKTLLEVVRPKSIQPAPRLIKAESMDIDYDSPQQKRRRTSTRITNRNVTCTQEHTDIVMSQISLDDDKDEDFVESSSPGHKGKNVPRATGRVLRSRGGHAEQTPSQSSQSSQPDEYYESMKREPMLNSVSDSPRKLAPEPTPAPQSPSSTTTIASATTTTTATSVSSTVPSLVACPICQNGIPEPYTNTHLDKFCLASRPDPDYTISYKVIIQQDPNIIALYTRRGTSTRDVIAETNGSLTRPGTPGRAAGATLSNPASPARQSIMQWQPQSTSNGVTPRQPMFTPKPAVEPKRIPKLTYSVLNDKQLRKKLQELGLPTNGDKTLMQKRHAEYTTIFNANCDSSRPKSTAELKKAMQAWERAYEQDLEAKETQRRILEQQQQNQRQIQADKQARKEAKEAAAAADATSIDTSGATPPSSQASNGRSMSSSFLPNQANNTAMNVAIASASAFAHASKYADEYAELIEQVRSRLKADKEKALAEKNNIPSATETAPGPSTSSQ
ncbi:E3 ubiquitin-protein ligase rad18 [Linnemannia exigua]|uniref:RING-type E3 ubiquitin transferase n=1 Tax=Linnemannia exigua TaxID=604196 RepID=A0AAD4H334_9FUNG|nr:E3 ubiquitin-protein ligase rad18 [Linnemannia exigua]